MRKTDFFGEIKEESGVVMAFVKLHEQLGFKNIVPSQSRGFDIDSITYQDIHDVTVEFEYMSSNFILHKHPARMNPDRKYVVVCWDDDCGLKEKVLNRYQKQLHEVIALRKYITIQKEYNKPSDAKDDRKYIVLSWNPKQSENKDFGCWGESHCFRVKTDPRRKLFEQDKLPRGSRVLLYRNPNIIGGFTVERYEVIDPPQTEEGWKLYKQLTDYPATLFTVDLEKYQADGEFLRGHIFYTDFFDARDFPISLEYLTRGKKKMSRQGKIDIAKEEFDRLGWR